MENGKSKPEVKPAYVKPKVLASYQKWELDEIIRPHGSPVQTGGGGGGSIEITSVD